MGRCLEWTIRVVYSATIPAAAVIGDGTVFGHNALAVVLNPDTRIGKNCFIGTHVVVGGRHPHKGVPVLEDEVVVHAGAKLLGPIRIGQGATIGANAVVLSDVPPGRLAVGVPAVVKERDGSTDEFLSDLLDRHPQ